MKNNLSQIVRDLTGPKEKNIILFIEGLKSCLEIHPFEKITVSDIVEASNKSRQTFYRCCENKYDLVNKYLGMIILQSHEDISKGESPYEVLAVKYRRMETEKPLFAAAFKSNDYESLHRYTHRLIFNLLLDLNESFFLKKMGEEERILLDMLCEESVYATVKWTCGEICHSPEGMARLLIDAVPAKLEPCLLGEEFSEIKLQTEDERDCPLISC